MVTTSANAGVVGPGSDIDPRNVDIHPTLVIDTDAPLRLGPGNYEATRFNYAAAFAGNSTPFLAILDASNAFRVLAIGDRHDIAGSTYGATTDFGSNSRFTLERTTRLYAGVVTYEGANPIRLTYGPGASVYQRNPTSRLVLNGLVDTPGSNTDYNVPYLYAFSIEVERARVHVVPEPASLLLSGLGVCALVGMRRKKRAA